VLVLLLLFKVCLRVFFNFVNDYESNIIGV